jgi:hypothetical protein
MDERTIARFWSKIDVRGRNECWPWIAGSRANGGYGSFSIGRKLKHLRAHRLSWELAYGPIPDGMDVLHKCDYPPCCNPECLFLARTWTISETSTPRCGTPTGRHTVGPSSPTRASSE